MSHEVFVSGVGMIPFVKPGTSGTYQEMGEEAVRLALEDSGATYDQVQQVYAGYVYGDSTCGQAAIYRMGIILTISISSKILISFCFII